MREQPRLLFIDQSGELGGAELSLLDIASHFRDRAEVVTFADGPFPDRLRERGVTVHVVPIGRAADTRRFAPQASLSVGVLGDVLGAVRRVAGHARRADLVVCNTQKALVIGALAGRLARRPVVWHLRDILTADHFSRVNRRVAVTLANRLCRVVIANSNATADAWREAGGRADRGRVIYNAVDAGPFEQAVRDASSLPERRSSASAWIGVFGRLSPWKGQEVVVRALADVQGADLVIVGDALFDGDQAYADRLRTVVEDLGLSDRVHFLGFRRDVPAVMAACDVVVHASTAPEPFGRVIVEGMLAHRPVIATDAGGRRS